MDPVAWGAIFGMASGLLAYLQTKNKLEYGPPQRPTPQALAHGSEPGAIVGGVLAWVDSPDDGEFLIDHLGRRCLPTDRVAPFRMYEICLALLRQANRAATLLTRIAPQKSTEAYATFARTGIFPTANLTALERQVLTVAINAYVHFGTSLRVLSRFYRAHGLPSSHRPASAQASHQDLSTIVFIGRWNPLVRTWPATTRSAQDPATWELLGIEIITRFRTAFPDIVTIRPEDERRLVADVRGPLARGGMGATPLVVAGLGALACLIVGLVVVLVDKGTVAVGTFLGRNVPFEEVLIDELEKAWEDCRGGSQSACAHAEDLMLRLEKASEGVAGTLRWGIIAGAAGGGGILVHRLLK